MNDLQPKYGELAPIQPVLNPVPQRVADMVTQKELNLLNRIRSIRQAGVVRVRIENAQPVQIEFVVDTRTEVL